MALESQIFMDRQTNPLSADAEGLQTGNYKERGPNFYKL
jgi:hypothetical protein